MTRVKRLVVLYHNASEIGSRQRHRRLWWHRSIPATDAATDLLVPELLCYKVRRDDVHMDCVHARDRMEAHVDWPDSCSDIAVTAAVAIFASSLYQQWCTRHFIRDVLRSLCDVKHDRCVMRKR